MEFSAVDEIEKCVFVVIRMMNYVFCFFFRADLNLVLF